MRNFSKLNSRNLWQCYSRLSNITMFAETLYNVGRLSSEFSLFHETFNIFVLHLLSDFKINSGRQHIRLNILVDRSVIVLVGPPLRVQRTSCFIENCRHRTQPVRVIFPAPTRLPTPAPAPIPSPPPLPAPHAPAPPLPAPHAPAVLCFLTHLEPYGVVAARCVAVGSSS